MATKKVAKKATKKVAKKVVKKVAPKKAPAELYIVVRDSCKNLVSEQLQKLSDAEFVARDCAYDVGDSYTLYKVTPVRRYTVPDKVIVEEL